MSTPKLPGYSQPPIGNTSYTCEGYGGDTHGQMPPTDATPISQHKQLAGDPTPGAVKGPGMMKHKRKGY